jgi:hypothetical protein
MIRFNRAVRTRAGTAVPLGTWCLTWGRLERQTGWSFHHLQQIGELGLLESAEHERALSSPDIRAVFEGVPEEIAVYEGLA